MRVVNGLGGSLGQSSLGHGAPPLIASFLLCASKLVFALPCVLFPSFPLFPALTLLSLSFSIVSPSSLYFCAFSFRYSLSVSFFFLFLLFLSSSFPLLPRFFSFPPLSLSTHLVSSSRGLVEVEVSSQSKRKSKFRRTRSPSRKIVEVEVSSKSTGKSKSLRSRSLVEVKRQFEVSWRSKM